ncbi:MAG: tripartite tricarboxylate transporter TctB family protein [Synergistaceae bacterium]|jgi:hypothetical protein|nr:tripartite tricarboxylate transporter TctB family protein [Synergistaceae bacterium]
MFKKDDWIFGLISIAVGAAAIYFTRGLVSIRSMDPAGPAALPTVVAWLMIVIGVVHVVGAIAKKSPAGSESPKKDVKGGVRQVVIICVACAIYYLLLESVGYILMTPPLIAAIMLGVGARGARGIITTSVFTTVFLFCVFFYALKVNMPLGILYPLFN